MGGVCMSNICTTEFLGRVGNNLFQVAACINYSKLHNVPWAIPPHYHHRQIYKYWKFPVYRGNIRKLPVFDRASSDETWGYCDLPFYPNGVKLRGFFQSYKYLDPVKEEVLKAWNFKVHDELKDFVSIHIRLGDYVTHSDYFPPVTKDYVRMAIDSINEKTGIKHEKFLVFSDEPDVVRRSFAINFPELVFLYSEGKNEYEEMSKMASCGHNIIANSSFSYIAAYANRNPDKIVITPDASEWFGVKSKLDTKDLLPPDWTQIKFRNQNIPA
jgi:hypothetical protein